MLTDVIWPLCIPVNSLIPTPVLASHNLMLLSKCPLITVCPSGSIKHTSLQLENVNIVRVSNKETCKQTAPGGHYRLTVSFLQIPNFKSTIMASRYLWQSLMVHFSSIYSQAYHSVWIHCKFCSIHFAYMACQCVLYSIIEYHAFYGSL